MTHAQDPIETIQHMLANDAMSQWLGVVIDEVATGLCRLHFDVREEMLNGFGILHGGVTFAAADSAFAFACNTHGLLTVALDAHISFVSSAKAGDRLFVEAKEVHLGNKTGFYKATVTNGTGELIATFTGTAYRKSVRSPGSGVRSP